MQLENTLVASEAWEIDPAHTLVEFSVKHLVIATVKGRFGGVAGAVIQNPVRPEQATIDVVIDAATIDTGVAQRDDHLRSPDFFDVAHFPVIEFHADRVEREGADLLRAHGNLSIRGITRQVVLTVEELGRVTDPYGAERAAYSARGRINRKDFGLTWNVALEAGGVMVGDDVKIAVEVELVRTAPVQ